MKSINTAGQALHQAPTAPSAASCGVLNPSISHSRSCGRACTDITSLHSKINNLCKPRLWLLVHLTVPLLLLLSIFFIGPVRINTALFEMLPKPSHSKTLMEADAVMGEKSGREIIILAAASDFESAKKGAALLHAEFDNSKDVDKSSLYFDSSVMEEFNSYLFDYRFVIAGKETLALLENGGAEEIAEDALASAFGAFTFIPLTNVDKDPFLLTERRMTELLGSSLLNGGNLGFREDVLCAEKDGVWHVLLRMTISPGAVSISKSKNVIGKICSAAAAIKETMPGLEFYFSGVPFHSYESSSGAQREISLISTVTLIIIFILFLFIFRSPLPVIGSVLAAGVSLGFAAASALLVFREIHIITFVFGTTLIGTCVDYSIHFFVHWKGNPTLKDGLQIRSHIAKSVFMCVISTEICFFVFLLAPFPILKQFAVFSMTGLVSSFLTVFCIFPFLKMPEERNRHFSFRIKNLSLPRPVRTALTAGLAFAVLFLFLFNASEVKIKNDLSSLYTMSASLLESEKRAAQVLNYGSSGWYFIVSGSNPEETLENEERLAARLEEEVARGNLGSFLAASRFVPSVKTQQRTYEAMKALLPLVPSQFENLGFPPEYAESFYTEFDSNAMRCFPEDAPSFAGVSNLWIGNIGGNCYSCVMPLHPAADESVFRSIADDFDSAYFVNKSKDIGRDLDTLTKTMLVFFLAACVVISILIFCAYPRRDSLKICAAPLFLALVPTAVLALVKIPIGFFSAAAFILVLGLGMDYVFYMTGKKSEDGLAFLAVTASFLTTLLSFGALALSSFVPVHIFGLTVSAGLSGAFIFAMLLQGRE